MRNKTEEANTMLYMCIKGMVKNQYQKQLRIPANYFDISVGENKPPFVNKALLDPSHTHSFIYCLWLLSPYKGSAEYMQHRLLALQNLKFTFWPFTDYLLTPAVLEERFSVPFCVQI